MSRRLRFATLGLAGVLAMTLSAWGQTRPYIGFVYPAGGQQGTTFAIQFGGQGLDGVNEVLVTGGGVKAKVVEYYRKFGPQEMQLLRQQVSELKKGRKGKAPAKGVEMDAMMDAGMMGDKKEGKPGIVGALADEDPMQKLIARIEKRMAHYVNRPACSSIAGLVFVEVVVAPDAAPGPREIRLATRRGVSNPLVFHVGQFPEVCRKPMITADFQVLGKEELALRKRPEEEVEQQVAIPCTLNGQIASSEINWYRFTARKGQRLVISTEARRLIPYIADAVPGWFQPVVALYDSRGKEVAYNDDYRFSPDPVLFFEVPEDGQYRFSITDALYRGREDFVYRTTVGELPFVTSIFPLGGRAGASPTIGMQGWNLPATALAPPAPGAGPGVYLLTAAKKGIVSNRLPFALDTLPEAFDKEPNNDRAHAQKVELSSIVNGRIDRGDDWDVFQVAGRAGEAIVAEVMARRLDSPLDSVLKITDAAGKLLAMNDDHEDPGCGLNTHHADSYLLLKLPADGKYFIHIGDMARAGGEAYAYRLRISRPEPDFALRIVPSSLAMRTKGSGPVTVYVLRKDGFDGAIKLGLKDPPPGFSSVPLSIGKTQAVARLVLKTDLTDAKQPVELVVEGRATIDGKEVGREAVPGEDRMQAFLWRHVVPAENFPVLVYDPAYEPPPPRVAPPMPEAKAAVAADPAAPKPKFGKGQVAGRLRQLKLLYEEWLLTDEFYAAKVAECEAAQ